MRAIAIVLVASLLAACGGGSTLSPMVPQHDSASVENAHRGKVRVKMRIVIRAVPRHGRFAQRLMRDGRRNPFYTASTTQGIDVQVSQGTSGVLAETQTDISSTGGNCAANGDASRTCTFPLPVPPGNDTFTITTYDGTPKNGGGFGSANKLGYSVFSRAVTAGSANTFPSIALSGIVTSLSLSAPIQQIHGTLPSLQALGLYALDADDNVILDSPYYDAGGSPISVALKLQNSTGPGGGAFALSASAFPSPPSAAVQLSYDGNALIAAGKNSGAFTTTIVAKVTGGTSPIATATQTVSLIGPAFRVFNVPGKAPQEIALGPDGNLWYTDTGDTIYSIAPDGTTTAHKIPTASTDPSGITLGPDGNMWFTELLPGNIGWITPGEVGPAHECPSTKAKPSPLSETSPVRIVSDQGNLYVLENKGAVAKFTTGCKLLGTFPIANPSKANVQGMAVAPNGNIWYTEPGLNQVGSMTPNGARALSVTVPKTGNTCGDGGGLAYVNGITADPTGNVWFTELCSTFVGQIVPSGSLTMINIGVDGTHGIAYGPDGNVWAATLSGGIVRVTGPGAPHIYAAGATPGEPFGLAVGADADLWFTDQVGTVGRFVW